MGRKLLQGRLSFFGIFLPLGQEKKTFTKSPSLPSIYFPRLKTITRGKQTSCVQEFAQLAFLLTAMVFLYSSTQHCSIN